MDERELKPLLDLLRRRYNTARHAATDPVSFVRALADTEQREVVGLVAAFLAYGSLVQIMRSVRDALERLGPTPRAFILDSPPQALRDACGGFVHRVVNGDRLWRLLWAVKDVLLRHGSLRACFLHHDRPAEPTVLPGLMGLAGELREAGQAPAHLVADPCRGSACKRWHLFLRLMVRRDAIDPGGWDEVSPSRLVVPLDAHTWRLWRELGLTQRRTCSQAAALEISDRLRRIAPEDPVKYDFALMHASASADTDLIEALSGMGGRESG